MASTTATAPTAATTRHIAHTNGPTSDRMRVLSFSVLNLNQSYDDGCPPDRNARPISAMIFDCSPTDFLSHLNDPGISTRPLSSANCASASTRTPAPAPSRRLRVLTPMDRAARATAPPEPSPYESTVRNVETLVSMGCFSSRRRRGGFNNEAAA
jgi:hypothetical protein